jgi:hypothetical protein
MMLSAYEKLGGIVWIPRMLRKIRLRMEGKLPEGYHEYLGKGFDWRCVSFLGVKYEDVVARVEKGASDDEILAWIRQAGSNPGDAQVVIWNEYLIKRGWRDTDQPPEKFRDYKIKYGLGHRDDILTYFDFYEVDEGRKP